MRWRAPARDADPADFAPMLVKVKTPRYPLQLAGRTKGEDPPGCAAGTATAWWPRRAIAGELCGFVVGATR